MGLIYSGCCIRHNIRDRHNKRKILLSIFNNRIAGGRLAPGVSEVVYKGWDWSLGSVEVVWYRRLHMGWPLGAKGAFIKAAGTLKGSFDVNYLLLTNYFHNYYFPSIL